MRLIDADSLRFSQRYARADPDSDRMIALYAIDESMIDAAPTVDAVLVVRCGECRFMQRECGHCYCQIWRLVNGAGIGGFCNYGERRESNEEPNP